MRPLPLPTDYILQLLLQLSHFYNQHRDIGSLRLNGTLFLFYAEDFNLLGENIPIVKEGTKHLSVASPEFVTEMYRKLGIIFATRENTWQNHNIKTANRASERKTKFKYLVQTSTNQNCMFEKIKSNLLCLPYVTLKYKLYIIQKSSLVCCFTPACLI